MSCCASVTEPELLTLGKDWLITGRVAFSEEGKMESCLQD